ncbi:MAG: S-methyl-5-thioribose-1-phosphate isomerase, partial [Nitrospirota bacterium]
MFKTIEWKDGAVRMLDQSRLPLEVVYMDCRDYLEVAEAIKTLKIRGAPAIGIAAAMGVALGAQGIEAKSFKIFYKDLKTIGDHLAKQRPTAVNLFWAIKRMLNFA